ncbi:MAG: cystathionine gamma-synthase [Actinomycetales bacterium mxb001]|nr:MAG: cystathionine gamma-synthase [Actinomycetales bacterium mxb001]
MDPLDGLALPSVAVHAGRTDLTDLGVHAVPIDLSTTAPLPDVSVARDILDDLIEGKPLPHGASTIYRRAWNPTVARFEEAVAALEGYVPGGPSLDIEGVAFASGMAATHVVILSRVAAGKPHVIAVRPLYGGTDAILESGILGTRVTYAGPDEIAAHVTDDTGLVVLETPSNPTLELRDIADIARQAGDVPVMIDNTFASPVLQQPLRHGAAYSVHSATKYLGGHGDAMGGVVVAAPELAQSLRPLRTITGGVMDPFTAYLMLRGVGTLPIRMREQQRVAGELARWLVDQPAISRVFYPGLPGADPTGLIGRQMSGPGAMLAFEMAGGFDAAEKVCGALRLITHAVSLGGIDTLIEHPASLTHRVVTQTAQPHEAVLRISAGLEDPVDLIEDLAQALDRVT